jgi:hypothetical protein
MNAIQRLESAGEDEPGMLQIPLTPTSVAFGIVYQCRRQLLVAAIQIIGEPHLPAGAAQQGGLDEIMTQDLPAERLAPRQLGQSAMGRECLDPNNGVVTPVVARVALPVAQAGHEDAAV